MCNTQKKLIALVLACLLVLAFGTTVWAAPGDSVSAESGEVTVEYTDGSGIAPFTNSMDVSGIITLSDLGNAKVKCVGMTNCAIAPWRLKVHVHLQQWINGAWKTIETFSTYDTYVYSVGVVNTVSVPANYYYRLTSTHTAIDGNKTVSAEATTDWIWIAK